MRRPHYNEHTPWVIDERDCLNEHWLPAWSLHRLIEMMDLDFHTRGHYIIFEDTEFMESKNIYDNLCDCFQWLIEDNRFNKEYLI